MFTAAKRNQNNLARQIGNKIRKFRQEKGWTLTHLSELADITKSHLSQLEQGKRVPSIRVVIHLAEALGKRISDVLTPEDD